MIYKKRGQALSLSPLFMVVHKQIRVDVRRRTSTLSYRRSPLGSTSLPPLPICDEEKHEPSFISTVAIYVTPTLAGSSRQAVPAGVPRESSSPHTFVGLQSQKPNCSITAPKPEILRTFVDNTFRPIHFRPISITQATQPAGGLNLNPLHDFTKLSAKTVDIDRIVCGVYNGCVKHGESSWGLSVCTNYLHKKILLTCIPVKLLFVA